MDDVVVVTIDRPEKRNAMNAEMVVGLRTEIERAPDENAAAVVVTGTGSAFCSGQDLSDRYRPAGEPPPDLGASIESAWNPLIRAIRGSPIPIVTAVNGAAAGAGCNLALAGHAVVAGRSAWFSEAFTRVGLMPDSGGTWLMSRAVGRARALGAMLLAGGIDAATAADWGLVSDVVDDDELLPAAVARVKEMGRGV